MEKPCNNVIPNELQINSEGNPQKIPVNLSLPVALASFFKARGVSVSRSDKVDFKHIKFTFIFSSWCETPIAHEAIK